ncbi:MAG: porin family protein, partial [Flavobacterium sp.]
FSVGFLRDMPINASRTFAVAAGLGYSLSVYNQNLGIFESNNATTYEILNAEGVSVSKDKLSLHYVDLPVEFRWRNATPDNHRFWRVHLGVKLSYLVANQYKLVSTAGNLTNSNLNDLSKFNYGLYLSTGWNTWNIYAYYGFNPIFTSDAKIDGQSIDMSTAKFGLMFYIL